MAKKKKIRAQFRKNRGVRARTSDWTRRYRQHGFEEEAPQKGERISGKGELARRRTVCGEQQDGRDEPGLAVHLDVDEKLCRRGRVLSVFGLVSTVEDQSGRVYQCSTRRLLKTLATEQRHVVAAGDRVDMVVGYGNNSYGGDTTGLTAVFQWARGHGPAGRRDDATTAFSTDFTPSSFSTRPEEASKDFLP